MSPKTFPVVQPHAGPRVDAGPPPFERVGLVGVGLIGGSIALATRRRWPSALVVGVDRKEVLERAMRLHAIDVGADDLGMLKEVDLVVLATPIPQITAVLAELGTWVAGTAVVTDTGSTKRRIVEAGRHLPSRLPFIGGHPLAGGARGGIEHARAELFQGRLWLVTPPPDVARDAAERLEAFIRGLGASPVRVEADFHDRLLAAVSHLPQIVVSALMHTVGEWAGEQGLGLSGPGLDDTTRLASSPPELWLEVCRSNADYLGEALDALIAALVEMRRDLGGSGDAIARVLASANTWRARLDRREPRLDRRT